MTPLAFMRLFDEFEAPSWTRWRDVLADLKPEVRELYAICGRGSGKSRIVALLATYYATGRTYRRAPGEDVHVVVIAPDRRQGRLTYSYIRGLLGSRPELEALVVRETQQVLELEGGVVVEVVTASKVAPRGRSIALGIVEEASFLDTDDTYADPDKEIVRALLPGLGRVDGSLLCCIGTPYRREGVLYEAWQQGSTDDRLVVSGDTPSFNPSFSRGVIDRAWRDDPVMAASEYGRDGDVAFRSDVSSLLVEAAIAAVTPDGVVERAPDHLRGVRAYAAFDAATGAGSDAAALGIAFAAGAGTAELAAVRQWKPPFSPAAVVAEASELMRSYGCGDVVTDRYAPGLVAELFDKRGIAARVSDLTTSDTFLELLARINSEKVQLLDHDVLLAELRRLERRSRSGQRQAVGHPPRGHDDVAAAAAAALVEASGDFRAERRRRMRAALLDIEPQLPAPGVGFTPAQLERIALDGSIAAINGRDVTKFDRAEARRIVRQREAS